MYMANFHHQLTDFETWFEMLCTRCEARPLGIQYRRLICTHSVKSGTIHASSPGPRLDDEPTSKSVNWWWKFAMYMKCAPIEGRLLIAKRRGDSGLHVPGTSEKAIMKSLPVEWN